MSDWGLSLSYYDCSQFLEHVHHQRDYRYTFCTIGHHVAVLLNGRRHPRERKLRNQIEPGGYGQFCPVAMAAEIVCSKWTPLLLRELLSGSTRFNDLRRGLPRMSPTLLSKRLKELEEAGVIAASPIGEYRLTSAGEDLRNVIMSLGVWGQRWIESSLTLKNLDPSLLMWDMRRNITPVSVPARRCTVQFLYPELSSGRSKWWLVIDGREVDLCSVDPGFEVDLYVTSQLRSMTAVWMGHSTLKAEIDSGNIVLTGDKAMTRSIHGWLGLSPFAKEKRRIAS
jgi:DNA-binding HxlR family transcriptional regulator